VGLATSSPPSSPTPTPSARTRTPAAARSVPRASAPSTAAVVAAPIALRAPDIGVTAPVIPVGVDGTGAMVIPEQVSTLGWYRFSAGPGASTGSMVIAGHVDSARQGLGAFFRLRDVPVGAEIDVTDTHGTMWPYRVVAREEFPKTTVPLAKVFSHYGAPRLSLVTCGGAFDAAVRSYEDNIVVTAVPA
jgi:sortase (surface protein transpeptidase)